MLGLSFWDTVFGSELLDSFELLGLSHMDDILALSFAENILGVIHFLKSSSKVWILEVLFLEMLALTGFKEFFVVFSHELGVIFRFG